MEIYFAIVVFMFGLLFGSFYNVVGYRIPNNMSIVWPHSFCPKCKHELKWYELIPVISFIIQKGKCRKCECKISYFYPVIELLTGILFLISYLIFGFSYLFFSSILLSSVFVIVCVSDFNYLIISDEVIIVYTIISIISQFIFLGWLNGISAIIYGLFMFIMMYLIMLLGTKLMKEEALGGGDVKLMFLIGTFISVISPVIINDFATYSNFVNAFFQIFLASVIASPFALISYFSKKDRVIPYGPFLLLATLIMLFTEFNILDFILKM